MNSFTERIFGGNPAAVFTNAEGLDQSTMQLIARQMNLVETVFVFPSHYKDADFDFCYFTPSEELPIAGHPTVAAILALIDSQQIDITKQELCKIKTNAGIKQISIDTNIIGPIVIMEQ